MANLRHNLIANLGGKLCNIVLSLAVVPVYLRLLGIEAYGLIGIFVTLMGIVSLFDAGLGAALNRELARYSATPGDHAREMRNLLRTLEGVYWLIGIATGAALVAWAPALAEHWLNPETLSRQTVEQTLVLIGLAVACMWPRALYASGLNGMQRQVALNVLSSVMAALQNLGGVVIVWWVGTIQSLVAWYACTGLLESVATGLLLWRSLPRTPARSTFDPRLLRGVAAFASGMAGIALLSVVLTQLDKVILSKVLTLEAFAYYTLAWRAASGLQYLITPITNVFFPRFSQLAVQKNEPELKRLYHRSCQLLSVIVLPVAVVLAVFPAELLFLWTHDRAVAANASVLLTLLIIGTALNGLMGLPLMVQLAHGHTRAVLVANTIAVALLGPAIYFASLRYGALGAAWVWLVLNLGYVLFLLRFMHRTVLTHELRAWSVADVGAPLGAALAGALAWRFMAEHDASYGMTLIDVAIASFLATAGAAAAAPHVRAIITGRLLARSARRV